MTNEHKLELMSKLCRDVLGQVPNGTITLKDDNKVEKQENMLRDLFWILGCSDIKVGGLGRSNALGRAEAAAADDNEVIAAVRALFSSKAR